MQAMSAGPMPAAMAPAPAMPTQTSSVDPTTGALTVTIPMPSIQVSIKMAGHEKEAWFQARGIAAEHAKTLAEILDL
jgi:hypothetical protein